MTGPTTETHSRDDESAEMDRVRARLRQDQPRLSTSPWGESNLSLSDTSDSSEGSQSRTTTKSLKAPPSSCFTANANQSSKDQGTSSKQQPLLKERQNLQGRSLQTRLDDDTFSSLVQGPAGENPKRECASPFVPSKAILRDESDSDEYHSFLDDCEDLDELDRQIEASIQAKAGTNPIPRLDLHAPVGRLKQPLRLNSGRELEPLTHLVELNYHDSLLLDDEVLDELDRKVEARLKASPPSNDFLFKTSTVDRPKSCGRSQSVICHSRNAKSVEGEMKVSSMKISHDRVYADIAQDRHDYGRPSETDTDVERNQRLSSKRKLVDQYKVNVTSGYTPKKRKQVPRSTSQPNHQRQSEKRPKRKEKASSVSKQLSTLQPSRRPLRGGQTAKTVEAIHRLTIEGTEMTDTSSEDSFAFFNESEINKIEERVRAEQRKRQPSIPSPLKAVVKPIEVDSTGNENAHRGSPGHEGNLDTDVASPPQHSTSSRRSDRDENDFDRAFGFKDDANIQKRSNRRACDDFGFSCQNNVASSLEKQQHYHDCSNFHGIETDERMSEIEPKLYAPTPSEKRPPPIVHRFSLENRPLGARRGLPVEQVYPWPIGLLWRTKFSAFNQMQSELANVIAYSDDNIVVSAPTGAGKTALFEMAMARFFSLNLQRQTRALNDHQQVDNSQKIVYVSPSKALCDERYEDWSTRLASMNLGIQVALITGDGDPSASYRDLAHANLVLTTPEKWDSLTRRWTENFFLFASVKLFLVDEVHLVADDSRGWCLESIVCRMKTIQKAARQILVTQTELQHSSYNHTTPEAINAVMRTVAVSATLPNLEDIATFVEANEAHSFDDSYRPVPLTVHVIGQGYVGDSSANQFRFWSGLDRNVPELIHRFSKKKPSLVFCHSKADTEKLAELLAIERGIGFRSDINSNMAGQTKDRRLQKALFYGLAYHHAGLEAEDRRLVEKCFSEGKIRVLCATSTLAMGVNLPAHMVIIKGTKAWRGGGKGYSDLDQATLLQMIGRAGRPGFDTTGTAIIMTDNRSKGKFERLASQGLDPAVSKLCTKLDEIINAEVSQNVIFSTESAFNWIKTSLFCAQLLRQPTLFGNGDESAEKNEEHLWQMCSESLHRLEVIGALTTAGGKHVFALPASHVMSHNLVEYRAMERFVDIPPDATQCAILSSLSQIEGMHRPVRRSEKKALKLIHGQLKYKLEGPLSKVTIQQPSEKAFVLFQASMMRLAIEDQTLRQEMNMIADFSSRMLSALEDFSVRSKRNGIVALQSVRLRRALSTKCWAPNEGLLHQLAGVDPATAVNLKMAGICSFDDVMNCSSEEIEKAANRPPSFGNRLKNTVGEVLKGTLTMKVYFDDDLPGRTKKTVVCVIDRQSKMTIGHSKGKATSKELSYTLIAYCGRSGECILYRRNVSSPVTYKAIATEGFRKVSFHLIASVAGLDGKLKIWAPKYLATHISSDAYDNLPKETTELHCHDRTEDQNSDDGIVLSKRIIQIGTKSKPTTRNPDRELSRRSEVQLARNEKCVLWQKHLAFVTPSPKPPSDTLEIKKILKDEGVEEIRSSHNLMAGPKEVESALASTSPSLERQTSTRRQSIRNGFAIRRDDFDSSFEGTWDYTALDDVVLVGTKDSNEKILFSPSNTNLFSQEKSKIIHQNGSQVAWKREKLQQHRTQQRAFVRKKDNPFSGFKCDPNNAENALDSLSSMNSSATNQVIPVEGLKALESAYFGTSSIPLYEGSHLTVQRRSGFTRSDRARRGAVLRHLSVNNGLEMRQSSQLGLNRGEFTSCSSVDTFKNQMAVYSRSHRPGATPNQLDDSWHGQLRGNYDYLSSHPSNPYPAHVDGPQRPDAFYGSYRDHGGYREEHSTRAAIQNWFAAENRDTGPLSLHEGKSGSFTAFDDFQGKQYYHGWG